MGIARGFLTPVMSLRGVRVNTNIFAAEINAIKIATFRIVVPEIGVFTLRQEKNIFHTSIFGVMPGASSKATAKPELPIKCSFCDAEMPDVTVCRLHVHYWHSKL